MKTETRQVAHTALTTTTIIYLHWCSGQRSALQEQGHSLQGEV